MNHRAKPLPADHQFVRPAHWVAPQGRPAWQARRCSAEPVVRGELDSAESCYQRDPVRSPPAVPWRALGAGLAVLICTPLALHLVLVLAPVVMQVAAR